MRPAAEKLPVNTVLFEEMDQSPVKRRDSTESTPQNTTEAETTTDDEGKTHSPTPVKTQEDVRKSADEESEGDRESAEVEKDGEPISSLNEPDIEAAAENTTSELNPNLINYELDAQDPSPLHENNEPSECSSTGLTKTEYDSSLCHNKEEVSIKSEDFLVVNGKHAET